MFRKDCREQAEQMKAKLAEVLRRLDEDDHLAALGAFSGLDDDALSLKPFLTRIAELAAGKKS